MSDDAIELLRRAYEAVNRRDWDAFLETLDPDVRWHEPEVIAGPTEFHGHAEVKAYVERVAAGWESWRVDPEEFVVVGERVVVSLRTSARGPASGVEVEKRFVEVWTVRDGKMLAREFYPDAATALRALGQGE